MRILLWGVTAGALAVLVSFLLFEEYSPLYQKFYPKPVPLSYGWAQAHAHFYLVLVLLNPSEAVGHIIVYVMMFIQWFFIGAGLSYFAKRRQSPRRIR